jgi:hypothetical protein
MKMVKSLLLGSAAGLVAVAGAQAADLPVKAKPVEYVKVCSLYGAGFFYIPGTDTCIKLGGAVRVQAEWNAGAGGVPVGIGSTTEAAQGALTRDRTNDTNWRTRLYFSVDARQQTEYGTLRSFFRFGAQQTTPTDAASNSTSVFWDRAFIQFAGFTVGKTLSFFDGVSFATFNYNNPRTMADTGPNGLTVWAYTWQFGNGISGTLSAEDPNGRTKLVVSANTTNLGLGTITNSNGLAANVGGNGMDFPDVIGALRVDQAWGSAQLMGAMHDASGSYYGTSVSTGHPSNAYGWAIGGAVAINLPTWGATSNVNSQPNVDQFQMQGVFSRGALGYATNAVGPSQVANGNSNAALQWGVDGIYSSGAGVELTSAWSIYGGYQHLWTPNWRTSLYGGYLAVSYDSTATAFACGTTTTTNIIAGLNSTGALSGSCLNYHTWQVGTRTQWNPVSQLDLGVDVLYSRVGTALNGTVINATGLAPTFATTGKVGGMTASDEDVWSVMFRVQRNFWP